MLGKGKLAELRALARAHGLASGSQTVPNSVVEIAAAQGRSPPKGPAPSEAKPAQQRKKLILRKPKRKAPQVIQEDEEEDDEATEDGLITKRKRVAPSSPPAPPPLPTSTPPSTPAPPPTLLPSPAPTSPVQAVPLAAALPVVEAAEPNFMENPRVPPRPMYQLEGVSLQTPQPQTLHPAGMKALTIRLSSSLNPRRRHHVKKLPFNNKLKKVVARTNNKPPRCLHKQASLLRSKGCGSPSQQN